MDLIAALPLDYIAWIPSIPQSVRSALQLNRLLRVACVLSLRPNKFPTLTIPPCSKFARRKLTIAPPRGYAQALVEAR
jgi:hypothetical protein